MKKINKNFVIKPIKSSNDIIVKNDFFSCKIRDVISEIKEQKWYKHLTTINEHKIQVGKNCFRCGLYKQGLLHDLSKYSWTEFSVGAKYYQGTRSPNEAEREDIGYTSSWLHHKGRNKHHLEYWLDYDLEKRDGSVVGMKMPDNYIVEMFCDRVAASKIYHKHDYNDTMPLDYYLNGKSKNILHPYTKKRLEKLLYMLAERGEEETFDYARRYVKAYRKYLKRKKYKKKLEKRLAEKYDAKKQKSFEKKYSRKMKRDVKSIGKSKCKCSGRLHKCKCSGKQHGKCGCNCK